MRIGRIVLLPLALLLLAPGAVRNAQSAPAWTGKVVFQSARDGKLKMWVLLPDGTATAVPNQPTGGKNGGPTWDPSGTRILFYHGTGTDHDVYVINEDGTGLENLTNSPGVDDRGPSWLPDGSGIVWNSTLEGTGPKIFAMSLAARVPLRCDRGIGARNSRPVIRRQGDMIAYNSNEILGGSKDKMMVGDFTLDFAAGKCKILNRRAVIPQGREWRPSWHPNGDRLVVAHQEPDPAPCPPKKEVFSVNLDGTALQNLTCSPGQDYAPMFSPQDGSQIIFNADRDGNLELYLMNADGSNQVNLTNSPGTDSQPDWFQP